MNKISATIVADSISPKGHRLTTFVLTYPRIIHSEFLTHRMLSKNSASSRAIPFRKMVDKVMNNPFIPIKWMKNHKGMQGSEFFTLPLTNFILKQLWLTGRNFAVLISSILDKIKVTKQITNRLLEPWLYHTVIVSGTEYENFFALRIDDSAEIHISELAKKMLWEYNKSTPKSLKPGEYHLPFGDKIKNEELEILIEKDYKMDIDDIPHLENVKMQYIIKIITARCARISYDTFEGGNNYNADIKLHDRLSISGHWSPMEHVAQSTNESRWSGNFRGYKQYRKKFKMENKTNDNVFLNQYITN